MGERLGALILAVAYLSMLWCGLLFSRRDLWAAPLVLVADGVLILCLFPKQATDMLLAVLYLPIGAVAALGMLGMATAGGFVIGGLIRERT